MECFPLCESSTAKLCFQLKNISQSFNSPRSLHLMNAESFRAFLIILRLGMRRSTDCKSMREYLNCLDCAIDAHLRFHLCWGCTESGQVRGATVAVKSVAPCRSATMRYVCRMSVDALAICGLLTTVEGEQKLLLVRWCFILVLCLKIKVFIEK